MVRINSTSDLNILPNQEIRYESCGETINSCTEIIRNIKNNIRNKKSELIDIANAKRMAKRQISIQEFSGVRAKMIRACMDADYAKTKTSGSHVEAINQDFTGRVTVRTNVKVGGQRQLKCENSTPDAAAGVRSNIKDDNVSNVKEEIKKSSKNLVTLT